MDDASTRNPRRFCNSNRCPYSVRQFLIWSARELGIELDFEGSGENEIARIASITGNLSLGLKVGDVICKVDPRYFRPH